MKLGFRGVCLLALAIWSGTAFADAHHNADDPVEPVRLTYEGKDYDFQYLGYGQPWVLDLSMATGNRDTPFHTLVSYYQVMKTMTDYGALMPYLRRSNGDAGERPIDVAQQMAAIEMILAGDVLIFGEILCQRRRKISPPGRSKTSPLDVMRYAVLGGCPGSP